MDKEQLQRYCDRADELLDNLKKNAHEKIRQALACGAISDDSSMREDNYILPKVVLTLIFEEQPYGVPTRAGFRKEIANLKNFI